MVKIGEVFHPDFELKTLYFLYLFLGIIVFYLPWAIPLIIYFQHVFVISLVLIPLVVIVIFCSYWISKYILSISYLLTENEVVVERGVWWKRKSTVPYNRITNIDVVQGPLSRKLGIASIKIQTAGYSVAGGLGARGAEAEIFGIKNFQEVRDFILNVIRGAKSVAVGVGEEVKPEDINYRILQELKKIRKLLEKRSE